jgi:hypothetical protein
MVQRCGDVYMGFARHINQLSNKLDFVNRKSEERPLSPNGEIIEDYLDDARGHSCLMLAFVAKRPLHVVCAPKDDYLVIITAYLPSDQEWGNNYRKRKKQ